VVERNEADGPTLVRVVIADDQRLVRTGFRVILEREPDLEIVGEAADGVEAVQLARDLKPDVVLMDIRMPHMDGFQASRLVLSDTTSKVLILTTFDSDEYVYEALRSGASGFLLIDPAVTRRLVGRFARALRPATGTPERFSELTARELDILQLIARGLNNSEIAGELVIEESTVKTHVGRILAKLGLRDRVQAVVLAYETGLVVPDHDPK
jgi:DNA-binding NarL/FixJ family response regulator